MRALLSLVIVLPVVLAATPLLGAAAVPDCDVAPPPPAQPPAEDFPGGGFGNVFLASPQQPGLTLPRNVELVLGGTINEVALGFWAITIVHGNSEDVVPSTVVGARVGADAGLLPANTNLRLRIQASETHPCQGCFGIQETSFATNDDVDTTAPVLDEDAVVLQGFVLPSLADQQACGFFNGDLHVLETLLTSNEPALFTVAGRGARVEPTLMLNRLFVTPAFPVQLNLSFGRQVAFSLGEAVVVVVTARDLAGNVSEPRVVRVRMRSFRDRLEPLIVPLVCSLDARPDVLVPSRLPTHPALRVVFPFEELPLSLRPVDNDGPTIPLVPVADVVEDARVGHMFQTARAIDPGRYDVVADDCDRCLCPECNLPPRTRITVEDVVDDTDPAAPEVRAVLDDASPTLSQGECRPDDAATLIVLAPGKDDVSAPQDLVYDAVIRADDGLPRPAGAALVPWLRADGDVVVRIPSGPFGRLIGTAFTLTLSARDAAGHVTKTTFENRADGDDDAGGCAAAPVASFVVLAGLLRRRRR